MNGVSTCIRTKRRHEASGGSGGSDRKRASNSTGEGQHGDRSGGSGGERASDGTRKVDHSGRERASNDIGEGRRGGGSGGGRNTTEEVADGVTMEETQSPP